MAKNDRVRKEHLPAVTVGGREERGRRALPVLQPLPMGGSDVSRAALLVLGIGVLARPRTQPVACNVAAWPTGPLWEPGPRAPCLVLRGGGKRQKRNARSTAHVLQELARTSLHTAAAGTRKDAMPQSRVLRTGLMSHTLDPAGTAGSAASFGRTAGEAGRQQMQKQRLGLQHWQQVRAPLRRRHRVVVDGSNVLKHGGGAPSLGRLVGLVAAVEDQLNVSSSEILVMIDHWVARELGPAALAQVKAGAYTVRIARTHVPADVRIQQAATALRARVVTNDRFLPYCPWKTCKTSEMSVAGTGAAIARQQVLIGEPRLEATDAHLRSGDLWLVSKEEWTWTARHAYRFKRKGEGGDWLLYPGEHYGSQMVRPAEQSGGLMGMSNLVTSLAEELSVHDEGGSDLETDAEMLEESAAARDDARAGQAGELGGFPGAFAGMSQRRKQKFARSFAQVHYSGRGHQAVTNGVRQILRGGAPESEHEAQRRQGQYVEVGRTASGICVRRKASKATARHGKNTSVDPANATLPPKNAICILCGRTPSAFAGNAGAGKEEDGAHSKVCPVGGEEGCLVWGLEHEAAWLNCQQAADSRESYAIEMRMRDAFFGAVGRERDTQGPAASRVMAGRAGDALSRQEVQTGARLSADGRWKASSMNVDVNEIQMLGGRRGTHARPARSAAASQGGKVVDTGSLAWIDGTGGDERGPDADVKARTVALAHAQACEALETQEVASLRDEFPAASEEQLRRVAALVSSGMCAVEDASKLMQQVSVKTGPQT